jgi:hypothetical protein
MQRPSAGDRAFFVLCHFPPERESLPMIHGQPLLFCSPIATLHERIPDMKRIAIFKIEQLHRGCCLHGYPQISNEERLARWIKRVHRNATDPCPLRMQLPERIRIEQNLPDAWVTLHADGSVIHQSTNFVLGHAT